MDPCRKVPEVALKALLCAGVVVEKVGHAKTLPALVTQEQVHVGGARPLQFLQQFGVNAELHDVFGLCRPSQLGVQNLVAM